MASIVARDRRLGRANGFGTIGIVARSHVAGASATLRFRSAWRRDPLRDGYILAASAWTTAIALGLVAGGTDARQFFDHRWPDPYAVTDYASISGFYYSPPVALLFAPLTAFGFQLFAAMLTGLGFVALLGILGRYAVLGLFFPPVWWDLSAGNVNTVIGFICVAGLSRPGLWAIPLLTKVTPGIGVLWFAARSEWRRLALAVGVTTALCAASLVVAPALWSEWIASLAGNGTGYTGPGYFTIPVPLMPRLIASALIVVWGARTDRRWTVPIAATLAMPVLWYSTLAVLVALGAFHRRTASIAAPPPSSAALKIRPIEAS
jgi:hypothetical protein